MDQSADRSAAVRPPLGGIARAVFLGLAVFLGAWICHLAEEATLEFTAFWPVNAIVLTFASRSRPRLWPLILAAGLAGNVFGDLAAGDSWPTALDLSVCNTFEIALSAAGVRALLGPAPDLLRPRNFWKFALLAFAAPVVTMAAAELVIYRTPIQGWAFKAMTIYILADGLGLLIVTPALLGINRDSIRRARALARPWQAVLSLTALATVAAVVSCHPDHLYRMFVSAGLIAVVFQLETLGAALGLLITTVVATVATMAGLSAAHPDALGEILRLQLFLGVSALINLSVASVLAQRRRLEEQLRQRREEAEAAARAKSEFLANMTHELRTPLTAILGFSDLLKGSPGLGPQDARRAQLICDASRSLLGVVNDILDFSKLEDGRLELEEIAFDPAELVRSAAAMMQAQAAAKGLELTVETDGPPGRLAGDEGRLRQVVLNLLSNAVKFTARGAVRVRARQEAQAGGRLLRIEVSDTGIGIAPEMAGHIFERFTQADASVTRTYGGTGLGLAISRRIVEAHGGVIGVDSRPGEGSTFWFELRLPLADEAPEPRPAPAFAPSAGPLRLLLAEDNPVNREVICAILAPFGVDIATAADGVEAVDAAMAGDFDAILMDVQMPGMDGLTATRRIRATAKDRSAPVPIIAMTANVLPEQVRSCREAGMNDHVGKPIELEKLLAVLDRWTGAEAEQERQAVGAA